MIVQVTAAQAAPVDALRIALTRPPTEASPAIYETFLAQMRAYLALRPADPTGREMRPMFRKAAYLVDGTSDLIRLFRTVADPTSGLDPATVAGVMMSGLFYENEEPVRAARAFDFLLEPKSLRPPGVIDQRQFEIYKALVDHAVDLRDWRELAVEADAWPSLRSAVSDALVSAQIEKLRAWNAAPADWAIAFAHYEPSFIDDTECARFTAQFTYVGDLVFAVAAVRDPQVRARLQEAAVRALKRPTEGTVRTLLGSIGPSPTPIYLKTLDRLRETHLRRARRRLCDHLFVAYTDGKPLPEGPPRNQRPKKWRVIEGGRIKANP